MHDTPTPAKELKRECIFEDCQRGAVLRDGFRLDATFPSSKRIAYHLRESWLRDFPFPYWESYEIVRNDFRLPNTDTELC